MPDENQIKVMAADNSVHRFPKGTDPSVIDRVMKEYVTKKPGVAPVQKQAQAPKPTGPLPQSTQMAQSASKDLDQTAKFIAGGIGPHNEDRPRWDDPKQILQDPHWYGRSARYLGGEFIGAGKAAGGMAIGGVKLLHDVASAINPEEGLNRPVGEPQKELGKDIAGIGSGIRDVGKDVWDLIRHFPEAASDPEHFGNTVLNAAMIVDGGVKGAKSVAELMKTDPAEAARVAHSAANGVPSRYFKRKAFEDHYVHAKGLDISKKITKAAKEIHKEIQTHASNISSQIDTAIPSGVIDAADEASTINKAFADVVKTPEKMHPALAQVVKDANATAPGQWTWEKARQFRSSIGRSLGKVAGPQDAVLTKSYVDLTKKLGGTAKKYQLGDSWDHYNELSKKFEKEFADTVDGIKDSQSGKQVAGHLSKDSGLTNEMIKNLAKYGVDRAEVMKFIKDSGRIAKSQSGWKGSLFRMAYGTPAGVSAMITARVAGGGWLGSVGAGALTGYAFTALINAVRAAKLSPEIIDIIMKERELPGRRDLSKGVFPTENLPGLSQITGGSGPLPTDKPTPRLPTPSGGGETEIEQIRRLGGGAAKEAPKPDPEHVAKEVKRGEALKKDAPLKQGEAKPVREKHEAPGRPEEKTDKGDHQPTSKSMEHKWHYDAGSIPGEPRELLGLSDDPDVPPKAYVVENENANLRPNIPKPYYTAVRVAEDGSHHRIGNFDTIEKAKRAAENAVMDDKTIDVKATPQAKRLTEGKPQITEVAEGKHGTGKLARQAKARERVAKVRKEKGSTALGGGTQEISGGGAAEAIARTQTPDVDISKLQIPEMEEALQRMAPKNLKLLQKARKAGVPDSEYIEGLKFFILEAYEELGGKGK